jgi:hypothetical protein
VNRKRSLPFVRCWSGALMLALPLATLAQQSPPEYDLMLLTVSDTHRNAVINRQLVREGDTLADGAVVESIREDSVLLIRSGEFLQVSLNRERAARQWPEGPRSTVGRAETTEERLHRMQAELIESMSVVQSLLDTTAREISRESVEQEVMRRLDTLQPGPGEESENE